MNQLSNILILLVLIFILLLGCQAQYDQFEQYQFQEMGFCRGLDKDGIPIDLAKTITLDENIKLCLDIKTPNPFTFVMYWIVEGKYKNVSVRVEESGWITVPLQEGNNPIRVGEYRFVIIVAKTQKVRETLRIVE